VPAAVVNASPLVFLARLGQLRALGVFDPVYTTGVVLHEVEQGLAQGHREILAVREAVGAGKIKVRKVTEAPIAGVELDPGELTVIQLCRRQKGTVAVVDDLAAIRAARHFGIKVKSTPFVLLDNVAGGSISASAFGQLLDRLLRDGYFLAPSIYLELLAEAKSMGSR
jgi:predicted nucleic acid-binding protein